MRRVLVVEDNPVNAFVALKQLAALGLCGSAVGSGYEALNAIRTGGFDAVLLDCALPDMSGFEIARSIRDFEQQSGAARTPIVAVTSDNGDDALTRCEAAGMDAHLAKPASLRALRDALARLGAPTDEDAGVIRR